jgi:lysophospholipase L1-like esterase
MNATIEKMVALGSSFAAGPGITPLADRWAQRSTRNYAHLVSHALGAELTDATISGATTSTILDAPQRVGFRRYAPQIDSVTADADLVTVTAGGNDLGYFSDVARCVMINWLTARPATHLAGLALRAQHPLVPKTAQQLDETASGLERIVDEIRLRAPRARIILVDYLPLFGADSSPSRTLLLRRH